MPDASVDRWARVIRNTRVAWTVIEIVVVETAVCGVAALPSTALWMAFGKWTDESPDLRMPLAALLVIPTYVLFALTLMSCSAAATRITHARTMANVELRVRDMQWPLLQWV